MSVTIETIIAEAKQQMPALNEQRVRGAYLFAEKLHSGQKRFSGGPYIQHPLEVTKNILSLNPDEDTIITSLLHDTLEDTEVSPEEIEKKFGSTVRKLAQGVEKINKLQLKGKDRQIGSLRKMFLAMAEDLRVIFIKLADRLHNMQTLSNMPQDKQKRIAEETLNIYAPIAGRLGIYHFKIPLEDMAFKYLYPQEYKNLEAEVKKFASMRERKIIKIKETLNQKLKLTKIDFEIKGRVKHLYSIYKKISTQKKTLEDIYDIFAVRILVNTTGECYALLGEIHKNWTPLSHRFKDYIAVPKPNGYQSLHTTVIGLLGGKHPQPVEIQIRTREMHREAEYGIAAHWTYKEEDLSERDQTRTKWMQSLVDLEKSLQDNIEFEENLKKDTFGDRIFVLTPHGDIRDLPNGATPIDFAYAIHTEIGQHCIGAKVNEQIVPLDHPLHNGDVIEILTNKNSHPNQFWLNFVVTSHAKQRIKAWFRSQDTEKLVKAGKMLLNKQLTRFGHTELEANLSLLKDYENKKLNLTEREDVLEKIGNGSLSPLLVVKKLFPKDRFLSGQNKTVSAPSNAVVQQEAKVIVSGEDIYQTKLASCCHPSEHDQIAGYVTRGGYITVHKRTCNFIQKMLHKERLIEVHWSNESQKHHVAILVEAYDRIGLIRDITNMLALHHINILAMNVDEYVAPDGTTKLTFTVEVENVEKFDHVINRMEGIESIKKVQRKLD